MLPPKPGPPPRPLLRPRAQPAASEPGAVGPTQNTAHARSAPCGDSLSRNAPLYGLSAERSVVLSAPASGALRTSGSLYGGSLSITALSSLCPEAFCSQVFLALYGVRRSAPRPPTYLSPRFLRLLALNAALRGAARSPAGTARSSARPRPQVPLRHAERFGNGVPLSAAVREPSARGFAAGLGWGWCSAPASMVAWGLGSSSKGGRNERCGSCRPLSSSWKRFAESGLQLWVGVVLFFCFFFFP